MEEEGASLPCEHPDYEALVPWMAAHAVAVEWLPDGTLVLTVPEPVAVQVMDWIAHAAAGADSSAG